MQHQQPNVQGLVRVACDCGWTESFSRGYSGLVVECARCGRMHRVAMFATGAVDDDAEVKRVMDKLLQQQSTQRGQPPAAPSVRLKPLFLASGAVCVAAVLAAAIFARPFYPLGVVVVGGAASWPLGLFVAWLGQRRQLQRLAKARSEAR